MRKAKKSRHTRANWLADRVLRGLIRTMLWLPYRSRVRAMGWMTTNIVAPLARYHRRSLDNLAYIYPEMSAARRREISRQAIDNMGRTLIENYSTKDFLPRMAATEISGPGSSALKEAQKNGRAVILVSGHFGNYEAARAALVGRGYEIGGLYRAAKNPYFNEHYAQTMLGWGGPVFEQGRKGTGGFVRHLKSGGALVLLFDQHVSEGEALQFLGKPAATATSAAQLALRYDALLIPFYGTRHADGLSFHIELEAPIEHSDAITMTRAMSASLESRIEANPEQWLWVHRRWKISRN